eukprot:scaffold230010_cov56-Cyclotella_meneghiniana.AAC.1
MDGDSNTPTLLRYGHGARVYQYPILCVAQMDYYNGSFVPLYGGFNVDLKQEDWSNISTGKQGRTVHAKLKEVANYLNNNPSFKPNVRLEGTFSLPGDAFQAKG